MTGTSDQPMTDAPAVSGEALPIDTEPRQGQSVSYNGKTFTTIREGLAHILIPTNAPTTLDTKKTQQARKEGKALQGQSVFYNPIQQFNRDLSVLAIRAYSEHVTASREIKAKKSREKKNKKQKAKNVAAEPSNEQQSVPTLDERTSDASGEPTTGTKRKADDELAEDAGEGHSVKRIKSVDEPPATQTEEHGAGFDEDAQASSSKPTAADAPSNGTVQDQGVFKSHFKILDALSATGLRAMRYAKEIPVATSITANDLSSKATQSIKVNVDHNRLSDKIQVTTANAMSHMYSFVGEKSTKYDVIDLDPYGTAVPFFDGAMQALNDGGLLCVTCTDAGVWASSGYTEKTFSLYGGNPIRGRHSHEGGLRLILNAIATTAAKYGIAIEPLMSLSIDFYARVFVRVRKSADHVKHLAGKTMLVYSCDSGCGAFKTQLIGRNTPMKGKDGKSTFFKHGAAQAPSCGPHCSHCGYKMHLSGPMWAGPLHNPGFLERLLDYVPELDKSVYTTAARIEGMISTALEETAVEDYPESERGSAADGAEEDDRLIPPMPPFAVDHNPFFFIPANLAGVIHSQAPGELPMKGALRHAGYRAVRSHTQPGSIRTNAPWDFIWQMMRAWVRQKSPIKEGALTPTSAGYRIMQLDRTNEGHSENGGENGKDYGQAEDETKSRAQELESDAERKEIVFDEKLGRDKERKRKLVRYQMNPRENWGPMNRATRR